MRLKKRERKKSMLIGEIIMDEKILNYTILGSYKLIHFSTSKIKLKFYLLNQYD